ncbi:seed maturation protein pm25-like protein [Colletotrichum asianum]|uniref:Seed maturation protein pm25-like protein n=1 Tax=Colletotrichum asianum TaxID=702518 RepID=A0A8H3W399_9PEZI|nr:seed maturation protein pm25-like protein [Colletotrichum asianum]
MAATDKETIKNLAENGHIITAKEVADIDKAEKALTGNDHTVKNGLAATAQSMHDKQQTFLKMEADLKSKPESDITKDDAKELQTAEARLLGHRPPAGSAAATFQSIADKNEAAHQREDASIEGKKDSVVKTDENGSTDKKEDAPAGATPSQDEAVPAKSDASPATSDTSPPKVTDAFEKKDDATVLDATEITKKKAEIIKQMDEITKKKDEIAKKMDEVAKKKDEIANKKDEIPDSQEPGSQDSHP